MIARIGVSVKRLRQGKYSAEALASKVEELGYRPYSRSALVNLEYGRKKTLDLGELIVLAEALNVPAVQLIYPNIPEGDCEFLPGQHSIAWHALRRFTGETAVPGQIAMADEPEYHLSLMRELDMIPSRIEQIEDSLSKARLDLAEARAELAPFLPWPDDNRLSPSDEINKSTFEGGVAHQERMVQICIGSIEAWHQRDIWIRKTLRAAGFEVTVPGEES